MVTGHTHVVRYSPNVPRAIQVMKDVLLQRLGVHAKIDEDKRARIRAATTHQELYQVPLLLLCAYRWQSVMYLCG